MSIYICMQAGNHCREPDKDLPQQPRSVPCDLSHSIPYLLGLGFLNVGAPDVLCQIILCGMDVGMERLVCAL